MTQKLKHALQNAKGFTLIELIIVIAVIVLLSAITIPSYRNMIESAKQAEVASITHDVYLAVMLGYTESLSDATLATAATLKAYAVDVVNVPEDYIDVTDNGDSSFKVTVTIGDYTASCSGGGMTDVTKVGATTT